LNWLFQNGETLEEDTIFALFFTANCEWKKEGRVWYDTDMANDVQKNGE